MSTLKERSEVADEFKWELSGLFDSDESWESAFAAVSSPVDDILALKGKLSDSAENLAECIKLEDLFDREISRIWTYAHLRSDEDTSDAHYMGMQDRVKAKYTEISAKLAWINPEILAIEDEHLDTLCATDSMQPYIRLMEQLRRYKPHTLSEKEERLLAMASEPLGASSKTYSLLANADLKFPSIENENGESIELTHGNFIVFLQKKNRELRQRAFEAVYGTYSGLKNTMSSTLDGNVKKQIFSARAHNHESALKASLFADNVEQDVYDSLIEAIHNGLPIYHKYIDLRAKCLGLETLDMYDQYVAIVDDFDMEVSWEEACKWCLESAAPLGDEYCTQLEKAFSDGWIDVYENRGKRSGAYSSGCYDSNPFVLMNYQNNLNSAFTLAHELGHSMHSFYSRANQPHCYSGYKIFVAEVASTTNEALLFDYLMKNSDDPKLKAYLLNQKCDGFKGTVYRQTMFAEFEKMIHEKAEQGIPLTPDELNNSYYELNAKFYGPRVNANKLIQSEWSRIPHFYYNFYVYKYATGFCAAEAFARRILSGDQDKIDAYIGFLKAGSSKDPIDILADAGVDMRKPDVIEGALSSFENYIKELSDLL